jgi:hypothetical protein
MQQEIITQRQFLEKCASGEKIFDNVYMQFFDISHAKFHDLIIKDSKIMFCTFRNCEFSNVRIENCTVFFGSFYTGTMTDFVFDSCTIEKTLFDNIQFVKTSMKKCGIMFCGLLNSNHASVDMSSSSQSRVITDISQLTSQEIEESIRDTMRSIERLDVSARMKIKEIIRKDADRYGLKGVDESERKAYADTPENSNDAPLTYGEVKGLIEQAFGRYGPQDAYRSDKEPAGKKYKPSGGYK